MYYGTVEDQSALFNCAAGKSSEASRWKLDRYTSDITATYMSTEEGGAGHCGSYKAKRHDTALHLMTNKSE